MKLQFFSILTLIFIFCKLDGIIDWSWWWVLAPTWGSFALVGFLVTIATIVTVCTRK